MLRPVPVQSEEQDHAPQTKRQLVVLKAMLLAAALVLSPLGQTGAADAAFQGLTGTTVRFASAETGARLLAEDDEWMSALGPFNLRAITGRSDVLSKADFRRWLANEGAPWPEEQQQRWMRGLQALAPAWNALRIPLPPEVMLVATTGREQAGRAYTRGRAIMLPIGLKEPKSDEDVWLLAHELWHVASRGAPELAARLYAEIGFEPVPPLAYPEVWTPIRLANPDAPEHRHAMRLSVDGREVLVMPLVVAARTDLKPDETFFNVLQVRLLEVRPDGAVSRAVLHDGEPVWHPVQGNHDYLQRLGGNTGYIIHPEETIADNVALLATGRPARNAELLARIRALLGSGR